MLEPQTQTYARKLKRCVGVLSSRESSNDEVSRRTQRLRLGRVCHLRPSILCFNDFLGTVYPLYGDLGLVLPIVSYCVVVLGSWFLRHRYFRVRRVTFGPSVYKVRYSF